VKRSTIAFAVCIATTGLANAADQNPAALATRSGCTSCHAVSTKLVGPPFKESSAKYKGKADAQAKLIAKLSAGKEHPEVKAKGEDLKALIQWVLAM
jgi:cytochrome c551/c552